METVIKWDRPQMVGEYYEPYRVDMGDAIEHLARVFSGENWATYECGRNVVPIRIEYISDWEVIRWA